MFEDLYKFARFVSGFVLEYIYNSNVMLSQILNVMSMAQYNYIIVDCKWSNLYVNE